MTSTGTSCLKIKEIRVWYKKMKLLCSRDILSAFLALVVNGLAEDECRLFILVSFYLRGRGGRSIHLFLEAATEAPPARGQHFCPPLLFANMRIESIQTFLKYYYYVTVGESTSKKNESNDQFHAKRRKEFYVRATRKMRAGQEIICLKVDFSLLEPVLKQV